MRAASIVGLTLVAVLAIAVSGCGSSSSTTTTTTTAAISKAEFVVKGNAICIAGEKKQEAALTLFFKKLGLKENQKPTQAQQEEAVEAVLAPNIQVQIDSVKALGAPSGEEQQVSSALEASQQALDKVKANPELSSGKESPFHAAGLQLHALGLTQCAKNS
jgi:maltose-binding protein MalE